MSLKCLKKIKVIELEDIVNVHRNDEGKEIVVQFTANCPEHLHLCTIGVKCNLRHFFRSR